MKRPGAYGVRLFSLLSAEYDFHFPVAISFSKKRNVPGKSQKITYKTLIYFDKFT